MSADQLTILAVDDEHSQLEDLARLLRSSPGVREVECASDGHDALLKASNQAYDAIFLDVRMPGLTGLDVARRIDGASRVVFVTAYGDHALAAFDAGAIDYVMKPVDPQRLARTIAKLKAGLAAAPAASGIEPSAMSELLRQLATQLGSEPPLETIQASLGKEVRLIPVDDVLYFEADSRYTRVVHAGGEAVIRTPLKELLARLPTARFWQVHRSIIVNQRAIASALREDDGSMVVTLRGRSERLPVSRHFHGLFRGQ